MKKFILLIIILLVRWSYAGPGYRSGGRQSQSRGMSSRQIPRQQMRSQRSPQRSIRSMPSPTRSNLRRPQKFTQKSSLQKKQQQSKKQAKDIRQKDKQAKKQVYRNVGMAPEQPKTEPTQKSEAKEQPQPQQPVRPQGIPENWINIGGTWMPPMISSSPQSYPPPKRDPEDWIGSYIVQSIGFEGVKSQKQQQKEIEDEVNYKFDSAFKEAAKADPEAIKALQKLLKDDPALNKQWTDAMKSFKGKEGLANSLTSPAFRQTLKNAAAGQ